ncbi:YqzL family protein [Paenactinomyces guangxiensis]|uniref:YqzL family protein n=1 Tax=Paenactinomyces guangxiensis TaxID=1490290 RepID=A0A7W1WNK5_9BACL|nr:YqzL family protein [Paenactinomyces guangxiensis]MBA4493162.1 YqzL family protein [Paenactinomyces guangxiensis]MBH8589988.1 YqzL family protein [Paenactinomyces guangxiensis]
MRNFIWSCFRVTGNIEAYLLYKEFEVLKGNGRERDRQEGEEEEND